MKYKKKIQTASASRINIVFNKTKLDNGLRILSEEVPGAESFALGISINVGSRDDFPNSGGLAHFLEHISYRHTKTRTGRQISNSFESAGAYANAYTTKEMTCFYVRALNAHFSQMLELLLDITFNQIYLEKDIKKEKSIIIEEIKSYEDDPEELIIDYADRALFGAHPLGNPIVGSEESVMDIDIAAIKRFHHSFYTLPNIAITYSGSLNHDILCNEISKQLNNIEIATSDINFNKSRSTPSFVLPQKANFLKPFQQAHILCARTAPGLDSDSRFPLTLLNIVLGDGMSSRLNQNLRERNALAYTVYSTLQQMSDSGGIYIYAAAEEKKAEKTATLIRKEISRMAEGNITKAELSRAKEQLKSSSIMALESLSTRMQSLAKSELLLGKYEDIYETIHLLDSVTLENVNETAGRFFKPENWSEIIFLPEP
jgi:predicted Zn-dependent peptidase